MMIQRTAELKQLEEIYKKSGNTLTLIVANKRSGKEDLIKEFCKDKKTFYYRARNASKELQLDILLKEAEEFVKDEIPVTSFEACFSAIADIKEAGKKTVIVLDEFQHMVKKETDAFNAITALKDGKLSDNEVCVILINSLVSWTNKEMDTVLGNSVSKIDERLALTDATFLEIVRAFPQFNVSECVKTYGVFGGVPKYLSYINPKKSIRDNIIETILSPEGPLFSEAEDLISSELRELSVYDTILSSIARGNEKLNDLYLDTGYSRAKIIVYLKNLASFDIIEKVVSFETGGWDNTKKGVYRIKNHFVSFYFRFIYPNLSKLYVMEPKDFYQEYIAKDLDDYLRPYFVSVCHEYLSLLNRMGKAPIRIKRMGTWVGKEGTIDVVGEDDERNYVVGICNWDKAMLPVSRYEELLKNLELARIQANAIFLFSATSFDKALTQIAKENQNVILVDMKEL